MKKILSLTVLVFGLVLCFSFKEINDLKSSAQVEEVGGLLVYAYSTPLKKHRVIGRVESNFMNTDYLYASERFAKRISKTYPTAEGFIIRVSEGKSNVFAEAIEFE